MSDIHKQSGTGGVHFSSLHFDIQDKQSLLMLKLGTALVLSLSEVFFLSKITYVLLKDYICSSHFNDRNWLRSYGENNSLNPDHNSTV